MRQLLHLCSLLCFHLQGAGKFKGQQVHIGLDDDTFIFKRPYKLNDMELVLVKAQVEELLKVG